MTEPAPVRSPKRTGILDDIENFFTGGYGRKEDLREIDKALRESYNKELSGIRHRVEKSYLSALNSGQGQIGLGFKQIIQTLDRLTFSVNRAEYGYSELFDRTSQVREEALNKALNVDRGLKTLVDELSRSVGTLEKAVDEGSWPAVQVQVNSVKLNLRDLEERLKDRETALKMS